MRAMHATEARNNFAAVLDAATEDNDEVVITRSGDKEPAVVISLREYESLKETAYLLGSSANARRLLESIENVKAGRVQARELADEDSDR
ncbi:type II toxin-antitoxin system Phd/YefM family antitoxin [Nocardia wallacei]|uniref:type II toxin-antitoxin system Phd/YefM family antitoxin n=1 Tax=Nocardia wallacei TaxID=480035 RepID=UPI002456FB34|nr:type II toxin-antitoxin system prevent-host-death family antitoxin [Nocardia wallacei]